MKVDAESYCYSALICIADACRAIDGGFFSWATAKLYYSCFYSLRSLLALRGFGVFYVDEKPKIIESVAGQYFRKPSNSEAKGGTHGLVINLFTNKIPHHLLLSQPISGLEPPRWMKARREEVNYGKAKYFEPNVPKWMESITEQGLRRSLNSYIGDTRFLYPFDPDHAALAFPILAIKLLIGEMNTYGRRLSDEDIKFLVKKVTDDTGQIAEWARLVSQN
ncbi:hypothetical protein [Azospirillum sp. TSA6c]|uniref:hypothetical protein n=1 Tax=unclassified Azospirillum TaxID=2630922 RepID=UPI0011B6C7C6|nr:hypothetical protein [Azospirillum sp. TSA6c]